jgi:hypothetical protein
VTASTPPATLQGHVNAGEGSNTARGDPDGPDFGEKAIQQVGVQRAGGSSVENNTADYGVLSPEAAAQYNAIHDAYFAPLEQQYGITPDELTQLFQQNAVPAAVQQQLNSGFNDYYNSIVSPDQWYDKLFAQLALGTTVGIATAGLGTALTPAIGALASGAVSGAAGGALSAGLTGQNAAKGALVGGVTGGAGAAASPLVAQLVAQGMNPAVAAALVKGGLGATTGAVGAAVTGGNVGQAAELGGVTGAVRGGLQSSGLNSTAASALTGAARGALTGQGALAGAESGALSGAANAVTGSVFGGGSTIFNSGTAANPTSNPSLTNPQEPTMALDSQTSDDPFAFLSAGDLTGDSTGSGDSTPNFGFDPSTLGNIDMSSLLSQLGSDSNLGDFNNNLNIQGGGSTLGGGVNLSASLGGGSNGSLLSQLASALGGGGGGNSALLSQLLGLGATTAGGALNSAAAKSAAGTYAGQTAFNPYTVNGAGGSTSFNGSTATSTLSPQQQQLQQMLAGLSTSSGNSLAAGPQAAITSDFNNRQSGALQAQQRLLGNTQDNEFANGILGSTAGGYQTQGALNAIGQQTNQNYTSAVNDATTQQQQQLAQLTAGINGNSNINAQQLAQLQTALQGGSAASTANQGAYKPALYANSNSTFGNALSGLGNAVSNSPYPTGP